MSFRSAKARSIEALIILPHWRATWVYSEWLSVCVQDYRGSHSVKDNCLIWTVLDSPVPNTELIHTLSHWGSVMSQHYIMVKKDWIWLQTLFFKKKVKKKQGQSAWFSTQLGLNSKYMFMGKCRWKQWEQLEIITRVLFTQQPTLRQFTPNLPL